MPQNTPSVRHCTIDTASDGQRIDNWLMSQLKGVPRSHVYKLIKSGQVRRNGGRVKAMSRIAAGDVIRIPPVRSRANDTLKPPATLVQQTAGAICLNTGPWIGVNKPVGVAVHAGSGIDFGLVEALRVHLPEHPKLDLAHRLDRDTSGALLIAKDRAARQIADQAFRDGRADKTYVAIVHGRMEHAVTADAALDVGNREDGERTVRVDAHMDDGGPGKRAVSHFTPLQVGSDRTLVEVRIETGRTHQIRVHAAHLGFPVAGDRRYGNQPADHRIEPGRMCLHARDLVLRDAAGDVLVAVHAPVPESFATLMEAR